MPQALTSPHRALRSNRGREMQVSRPDRAEPQPNAPDVAARRRVA